jgi:hypothetical protein
MNFYNGFSPAQRVKALNWSKAERAEGKRKLKADKCMACGQTHGLIQFHSEDYSEPFGPHIGAYEFCYRCHIVLHCRHRNPIGWERYKMLLRFGFSWVPMSTPNFQRIQSTLNGTEKPVSQGEPRDNLIFDEMKI